ncbi:MULTISPECIES: DUF7119 family protein [Halomicrobium]|uniref:DUF7119 domain-containing protein n=2 Tax=Halomicrobium mukohataei TaxID=57705 RepID=C7NXX8_HALMD|nr:MULTISPECIES: hypothetical protein [Halomicrobium]ACV46566.1 conserved hypothetical protein [Halomicrobium mukohataei DSM 12286]QCD65107.1 hypothetical protein E5139_05425 [Halomicrobium mukohataei]QFR19913.1 hypothetical protein GBQ70_05420 [Halomicrobium sp. ZPS1]
MTADGRDGPSHAERESPVGKPVIRGDPSLTGQRAQEAVEFDPDDPESLELAARTVRAFSENTAGADDNVYMLRGAAACAALVRGEGSYKAAAERAGGDATVSFIRKWSRVHDLPRSIRRHVAMGHIAPTAAKHIARVGGEARLHLAWAALDHDLTVRQVRSVASDVNEGQSVASALEAEGVRLGELELELDPAVYRELRRRAALDGASPGAVVSELLADRLD